MLSRAPLSNHFRYDLNSRHFAGLRSLTSWADFVEEVGKQTEMNALGHSKNADSAPLMVSLWTQAWHWYQLCQLSEVLGGCCEKELIACAFRSS